MATSLENDLQCPSCLDIFKDPVMLKCSHSFCRACVQQWWEQKGHPTCPLCRTQFRSLDIPPNLALRNTCETFLKASMELEDSCGLHKEKLKLFCLDHQELVCFICRDAEIHAGHKFRPLDEVVRGLQEGLQNAKERLQDYKKIIDNCNDQAAYIKIQTEKVESKIRQDFEELRGFLRVEEEARLSAVKEEERKKTQRLKEKIEALSKDMDALSDTIRSTEEQLTPNPVSILKNCKTTTSRIQKLPDGPEPLPGALLDEAKHVGNLKFSVWERMKEMVSYSPVILDPNMAGPALTLSEDLTSVSFGETQQRPNIPERPEWSRVLGPALSSGTHSWDVEVGDNANWALGVISEDPRTRQKMTTFRILFQNDKYTKSSDPLGSWIPPVKLRRIRVQVDTDKKSVSFSESLANVRLFKTKACDWPSLSDRVQMFPYFFTSHTVPLQIIPLAPRVTTPVSDDVPVLLSRFKFMF